MIQDLTIKQELLAKVMSDISEKCYCAGWMQDLEYALWDAVANGERPYGRDVITQRDIDTMKLLSDETNSWIIYDGKLGEIAVSLEVWIGKFRDETLTKPGILK